MSKRRTEERKEVGEAWDKVFVLVDGPEKEGFELRGRAG